MTFRGVFVDAELNFSIAVKCIVDRYVGKLPARQALPGVMARAGEGNYGVIVSPAVAYALGSYVG